MTRWNAVKSRGFVDGWCDGDGPGLNAADLRWELIGWQLRAWIALGKRKAVAAPWRTLTVPSDDAD